MTTLLRMRPSLTSNTEKRYVDVISYFFFPLPLSSTTPAWEKHVTLLTLFNCYMIVLVLTICCMFELDVKVFSCHLYI